MSETQLHAILAGGTVFLFLLLAVWNRYLAVRVERLERQVGSVKYKGTPSLLVVDRSFALGKLAGDIWDKLRELDKALDGTNVVALDTKSKLDGLFARVRANACAVFDLSKGKVLSMAQRNHLRESIDLGRSLRDRAKDFKPAPEAGNVMASPEALKDEELGRMLAGLAPAPHEKHAETATAEQVRLETQKAADASVCVAQGLDHLYSRLCPLDRQALGRVPWGDPVLAQAAFGRMLAIVDRLRATPSTLEMIERSADFKPQKPDDHRGDAAPMWTGNALKDPETVKELMRQGKAPVTATEEQARLDERRALDASAVVTQGLDHLFAFITKECRRVRWGDPDQARAALDRLLAAVRGHHREKPPAIDAARIRGIIRTAMHKLGGQISADLTSWQRDTIFAQAVEHFRDSIGPKGSRYTVPLRDQGRDAKYRLSAKDDGLWLVVPNAAVNLLALYHGYSSEESIVARNLRAAWSELRGGNEAWSPKRFGASGGCPTS